MNLQSKTILILEDENPLIEIIEAKLIKEGYNAVMCKSVKQALIYLKGGARIDLIWLDHYLFGDEDGLDFVRKIKQMGATYEHTPILVISNTISAEKIQLYLELGVTKCYTKIDFRLDQIITDIKEILGYRARANS